MVNSVKRILCLVLSVILLVCAMPLSYVYAEGNGELDLFEVEPSEISVEMENAAKNFMEKADKVIDSSSNALGSFANVMTGMQFLSYTFSAYNGAISVLQFIGVVEDPSQKTLNSILQEVNQLRDQVQKIDTKVTKIQKTLETEFSRTDFKIDTANAALYKQNWSDFLTNDYRPMVDFFKAYEQQTKESTIAWAKTWNGSNKTDLRCLYNKDGVLLYSGNNYTGFNEELPVAPRSSDDKKTEYFDTDVYFDIILPSEYLALNGAEVNADNYIEIIRNTVSSAVNKAMADGKINVDAENLSYWKKEGIKTNDDIVAKITDDMVNSIFFEVNSQMANAKYDNSTSYASKAANLYENLCDAINGADGRNVALKDILKNLSLTYAFEGDAKESATAYYGLIGTAVMQYGEFTSTLVSMNANISSEKKTALFKLTADTLKNTNDIYDGFITGNDNYCYPLNGVVTYVDIKAQSVIKSYNDYYFQNGKQAKKNNIISDWAIVDSTIDFDSNDMDVYKQETKKSETALRNSMLNTRNLIYLSYYINASSNSENLSVVDYLKKNSVISSDGEHSTTLVTPDFNVENQPLDNTLFKSLPYANDDYKDKYYDDKPLSGYEEGKYVKAITDNEDYLTPLHDRLVGTTFLIDKNTADIGAASEGNANTTLGVRILQYRQYETAGPRYFLYDEKKSDVSLSVSENATDPKKDFQLQEAFRCIYTVKAEKSYGALCVNYNKNSDPYTYDEKISNKDDFVGFLRKISNGNTYEGKRILLTSDIDLSGVNLENYWSSVDRKCEFKGYFNGNNKTIANITNKVAGHRVSLFRTTGKGAVIENLKIENVNFSALEDYVAVAALVGYANGDLTVKNVQILSGILSGYKYVGSIVGESNEDIKINILDCLNNAEIVSRSNDAGGMLGNVGEFYIRNSVNNGKVTADCGCAGGIVAYTSGNAIVRNSKNTGEIVAEDTAGGLVGKIESDYRFSNFTENENTGTVKALTKGSAGGIVGWTDAGGSYIGNTNNGTVVCENSSGYAGGILGGNEDDPILIKNNTNVGSVKGINKTGGIAGVLGDKDHDNIVIAISNTNNGSISATAESNGDAGGIFGAINTDNTRHEIKSNTNTGEITAQRQAGGIIGYMAGGGLIEANTNRANISSLAQNAGGIVGKIEDDSCQFKDSTVEGKPAVGIKGVNVGYVIFAHNTSMHAGRICGWDGYKKAVINSDSLLATIFGQGSVIMIIALAIVLAASAAVIIIVYKKRKKNSKDSQSE